MEIINLSQLIYWAPLRRYYFSQYIKPTFRSKKYTQKYLNMLKEAIKKMRANKRKRSSNSSLPQPKKCKQPPVLESNWKVPRKVYTSSKILHEFFADIGLMIKSANGILFKATEKSTGRPVCLKQIEKTKVKNFRTVENNKVPAEIYYHYRAFEAGPKYVIEPIYWLEFSTYYIIIMDRPVDFEDLFEVTRRGPLDERTALILLTQAVRVAQDLHKAGICHRDIKDENLLVNMKTLKVKLIDFGSSTDVKQEYTVTKGTPEYWPPEYYLENHLRPEELTIWSLGAVFYIMLTSEWNFTAPAYTPNPDKMANISMTSRQLLRAMLCANPSQRCQFKQLELRNC